MFKTFIQKNAEKRSERVKKTGLFRGKRKMAEITFTRRNKMRLFRQ